MAITIASRPDATLPAILLLLPHVRAVYQRREGGIDHLVLPNGGLPAGRWRRRGRAKPLAWPIAGGAAAPKKSAVPLL